MLVLFFSRDPSFSCREHAECPNAMVILIIIMFLDIVAVFGALVVQHLDIIHHHLACGLALMKVNMCAGLTSPKLC